VGVQAPVAAPFVSTRGCWRLYYRFVLAPLRVNPLRGPLTMCFIGLKRAKALLELAYIKSQLPLGSSKCCFVDEFSLAFQLSQVCIQSKMYDCPSEDSHVSRQTTFFPLCISSEAQSSNSSVLLLLTLLRNQMRNRNPFCIC